jgi:hypothetical protein
MSGCQEGDHMVLASRGFSEMLSVLCERLPARKKLAEVNRDENKCRCVKDFEIRKFQLKMHAIYGIFA